MPRGNKDNLRSIGSLSTEEQRAIQRKGGIKSGEARRQKSDMRELMKMMLDESLPKDKNTTYAQRLTQSMLTIAGNPKQGVAAVRAYETILHITGQEDPEPKQDALDMLRMILENNKKNAELPIEQETE